MDIGLVLQTDPPASRVVELAARAELGGFSHVWTFDSSVLWQEPFVIYSQILSTTSQIMVGPMVTNPLSREPSVTASLFATLNDMFGNRTVCGIGRGDSAMRVLGRTPSSLATLTHAIRVILILKCCCATYLRAILLIRIHCLSAPALFPPICRNTQGII